MDSVIHVPTCMGAVVVAYNLDGVNELKLSGEVIASIFAGEIKMWNDERLAALNPSVQLPEEASSLYIVPMAREQPSCSPTTLQRQVPCGLPNMVQENP